MINPVNLIKIDDIRDSSGKTFHIGQLPDYDQEDYDLSNPKDFSRYIKDIKAEVRGSFEYRAMVRYLKEYCGMDRSGLNPDITNNDSKHVKIEIHHTPFVLEDIVRIVYEKRLANHEDLSVEMVAKEVMACHYRCIIGLYPLSSTEHELVHNGYLFIPPSKVFGRYDLFIKEYGQYMDPSDKETIEEIEAHEKSFNPDEQNMLLSQSNIYLDPEGAYQVPQLDQFSQSMSDRIDMIRDNMYTLPTVEEVKQIPQNQDNQMIQAIYFLDDSKIKEEE